MSTRRKPVKTHSRGGRRSARRPVLSKSVAMIGAILVLGLIALLAYVFRPQAKTGALPAEISVEQAYAYYQTGDYFFLDVREQEEWDAFHIPGTTLLPLGQLSGRLAELPTDKPIIVVCRSGNRSQEGRDILLQAGFTDVTSMAGGVSGWSNFGYPIDGTRP